MKDLQIRTTRDGSNTVFSDTFQESYHSIAGAVTESKHVFINAGLRVIRKRNISIFEMGFGTGLNALLTFLEAQQSGMAIRYTAIELYPPKQEILTDLANNFSQITNSSVFHTFH